MRLEQLEYLMEIHKTHSISLASQNLHISQQNISKAIQNLENELDVTLLERSHHGTYLTPSGLVALKHAQKVFHELSTLKASIRPSQEQNHLLEGTLRIMYANAFSIEYISSSVQAFLKDYPRVQVSVYQKSLSKLLLSVHHQEIDIGLISTSADFQLKHVISADKLQSIAIYPLAEDTLMAAVSHTSPFASQKSISITKLLKHPLLLLTHESDDDLEQNWLFQLLNQHGTPQFNMITNTMDLYVKAITDHVGIGFYSQSYRKWLSSWINETIIALPIRPAIALMYGYVLNNYQPISATTAAFLPYLTQQLNPS